MSTNNSDLGIKVELIMHQATIQATVTDKH